MAHDIAGDREKHIAEGNAIARSMTLLVLLDEYMPQKGGKIQRYRGLHGGVIEYGHKLIVDVGKVTIRKGMAKLVMDKQTRSRGKKKEVSGKRSSATFNSYLHAL